MSLDDSPIVWAICTILVVAFVYKLILDHTRDVPLEYLESQSVVDSTRENNESAIYKSTKLDYSSGLRVGLGIRYDHYKLRNGNLCDVWEIMLRCLRSDDQRVIRVGKNTAKVSHLNFQVDKLAQFLHHVDEVYVVSSKFIASAPVLAITIACFVSNTTLHVYGDGLLEPKGMVVEEEHGEFYLSIGTKKTSVTSIVGEVHEKTTFENVYTPEKDKGIALRVTSPINARVSATTNFTQTNLVSAAASCVKHLPPNLELGEKDRVAIIQSVISSENISSSVVKMLTAFISQAELSLSWIDQSTDEIMSWNPTIVCGSVDFIQSLVSPPLGVEKLLYYHRLFALSRLKFSSFTTFKKYPALRLVFAHRSLKSRPYTNWNTVRASLCVQVVEELGYFNVAGPMIVSDVYDYRQFPESVTRQISACGTVVQANEAKLVNYNGVDPGDLCIRGYNIGKATTTMANVGEKVIRPDSNGFYTFPVEARWGTDGCLYIMST